MSEPREIYAGDSLTWTVPNAGYAGYTLAYSVTGTDTQYTISGAEVVNDSEQFTVTVGASTTQHWEPGRYRLIGYVTSADERIVIFESSLVVKPNLTEVADRRSKAEMMLDAVEAMLIGKASQDQMTLAIDGRSITRYRFEELVSLRDRLKQEVARERRTGNGRVMVRFK